MSALAPSRGRYHPHRSDGSHRGMLGPTAREKLEQYARSSHIIPKTMKAEILGAPKLLDSGQMAIEVTIGTGPTARTLDCPLEGEDVPVGGYDAIFESSVPFRVPSFSFSNGSLWLFRGKIVRLYDVDHLTPREQELEVVNAVLKHEKRYSQLQRQLEAFSRFEQTEAARRERIPQDVKLFVWQRDEGKCVQCCSRERLEYDHIIPVAKGGSNTARNIQLLCEPCNRAKSQNI